MRGARFAVVGWMVGLGGQGFAVNRSGAERARQRDLDGVVIVDQGEEGAAMIAAATGLSRLRQVDCPEAAAEPLLQWLQPGDVLLLKASRGVALERLIPLL